MALAGVDIQLIAQTVLYFASSLAGFATAIPIGLTMANFNGKCILYADTDWKNQTHFTTSFGGNSNCNFAIYACVFGCILYGAAMGAYHTFAICKGRKDPSIASQMWVMPFMLTNGVSAIILFISSCMVSVGFSKFCSSLIDGAKDKGNPSIPNCAAVQTAKIKWQEDYDSSTFFNYLTVAQIASWVCFLVALLQAALCILRLYRNRRGRSKGQIQGSKSGDTQDISKVEPTA